MFKASFSKFIALHFLCVVCALATTAAQDVANRVDQVVFDDELRNACHQMIELLEALPSQDTNLPLSESQLRELDLASRRISLHGSRFRSMFGARHWNKVSPLILGMYGNCAKLLEDQKVINEDSSEAEKTREAIRLHLKRLELDLNEAPISGNFWSTTDYRPRSVVSSKD